MAEVTHDDLLVRVEATEKEVAILDTKINRIQKDVSNVQKAVDANGAISRETQTQLKITGRILLVAIALAGLVLPFLNYLELTSK